MSSGVQNKQKRAFETLISSRLPEIIKSYSERIGENYKVTFEPLPMTMERAVTENRTYYIPVKTKCIIEDVLTSERVSYCIDLLKLPVYQDLGFMIHGNYMQILDMYDRTPGWSFSRKKVPDKLPEYTAKALAVNGRNLCFLYDNKQIALVNFKSKTGSSDRGAVSVSTFFRAISPYSAQELLDMFDTRNPYVLAAFSGAGRTLPEAGGIDFESKNDCIEALAKAMLGTTRANGLSTISMKLREINNNLFSARYLNLGAGYTAKLDYVQSFVYRANHKILAEDVKTPRGVLKRGITLTQKELSVLDKSPVNEIRVQHGGKQYLLQKFSNLSFRALDCILNEDVPECGLKKGQKLDVQDLDALNGTKRDKLRVISQDTKKEIIFTRRTESNTLTLDDVFTAFSIWMNNLNGYDTISNQYELTNRKVVPYDIEAADLVSSHMSTITNVLEEFLGLSDASESVLNSIPDFSTSVDPNAFITRICDQGNKASQMSDMCNITSFISKNNKVTSNLGAQSVTPDLVNVQDLQEGRLDAFDVPESSKIGVVHNRTMLSSIDKNGAVTSPFLVVKNGEVVSDEPVYLTATEESDKYIAEWNETFLNPDGTKKKTVRASYNGSITSVDTSLVSYKQYSSLQTLSISHAMVTFPGHSNGKRITMACNQVRQAVPLVNRVRPYSNACGESLLDAGVYYCKDITTEYYNDNVVAYPELQQFKDEILASDLKLVCINSSYGNRSLMFSVLAAEELAKEGKISAGYTAVLSFPYLMKNSENGVFSYDVNHRDGGVYHHDDVIAYNNGMSLEDKKHVMFTDFGAQSIDEDVFNKGTALVQNLVVFYKTCASSTIDDACTISRKLVGDDTLTSLSMFTVTDTLRKYDNRKEEFAVNTLDAPKYFDYNGLPKVGTMLVQGDPVICKVTEKRTGEATAHYKYLDPYVSGQVVHTSITTKDSGEKVAEVCIAQRSYIHEGDKLTGRHGNKGVVARILPEEEMPYIPELGLTADIVLSPLGIPSRQNISQLLDAGFGLCMKMDDTLGFVSPYVTGDLDFVREQMKSHGVKPAIAVDGRTGLPFKRPVNYGVLGMYKLHHMAFKKAHAIGMDVPVDPVFLQPRKGAKMDGGQSIGEMELWALTGVGANKVVQELFSTQSDDILSKRWISKVCNKGVTPNSVDGDNHNDLAMQACFRSMGVEFVSADDAYEFRPVDDTLIKSLSMKPVTSDKELHSISIFGLATDAAQKTKSRDRWGWIHLNCKMVNPLWIEKGSLHKMMWYQTSEGSGPMPKSALSDLINGRVYLYTGAEAVRMRPLLVDADEEKEVAETVLLPSDYEENKITGMQALVHLFETYDLEGSLERTRGIVQKYKNEKLVDDSSYDTDSYRHLIERLRLTEDFVNGGQKLTDYVISVFPIMPQIYRPVLEINNRNSVVDFDWHYKQIINAANGILTDDNVQTELRLYNRIREFIGLGDVGKTQKHQNLLSYFAGKNKQNNHGKIRSAMQSKRVVCSGRATIAPMKDLTMTPKQIGVPIKMIVKMYEEQLIGHFNKMLGKNGIQNSVWKRIFVKIASANLAAFTKLYDKHIKEYYKQSAEQAMRDMRGWIVEYCEGSDEKGVLPQVVLTGRQPTLHKYSIRAYHPKVIDGEILRIHPLVCAGYNADFDGDQMWITALLSLEAQEEAMQKMCASCDFINPKDSSVMLSHTQDIVLGCYCATMLENNSVNSTKQLRDAYYYNSIDMLEMDVFSGIIEFHDLVVYTHDNGNRYLSTAGRILFNALLENGFTDEEFSNPLNLAGVTPGVFKDLQYDALITGGKGGRDSIVYYSLKKICSELYEAKAERCLEEYQNITVFGFKVSDVFSVSLSLEDLDVVKNRAKILDDAARIKVMLEDDFQNGLISAEDKKDAVYFLYNDNNEGVNKRIKGELLENLSRDNNIFIMMESGARGNETQVMQMCGIIGNLQKTKTEDLEDPVTSNYYDGLSSFDMHMASYSSRIGVATTQNETRSAGYSTHQVVFMTSGVKVVESDCGKDDWWFDVIWADRIPDLDKLTPTQAWFTNNLLGRTIDPEDVEAMKEFDAKDGVITEESFMSVIMLGGFHSVRFANGMCISIDADQLVGQHLSTADHTAMHLLKGLLDNGRITWDCLKVLQRHAVKSVETEEQGVYTLRYKMDSSCRSLLLHREARALPSLRRVINVATNEIISVITEKTLDNIEIEGLDRIEARVLLDCKSQHGICAHCFGLKYSNLQLPDVGEFVGTEAAQAIGEPAAQLTLSLVNKGGVAGESVASGVQIFEGLLNGNILKNDTTPAKVAPNNGYVRISEVDKSISVCIEPDDKGCELCQKCLAKHGTKSCPLQRAGLWGNPGCLISERIDKDLLIPINNEWIESGKQLTIEPFTANDAKTYSMVNPDLITSVNDSKDPRVVLRLKQMTWLLNYYRTFTSNNIYINARHFEILARIQNNFVTIVDSKYDAFKVGDVVEVNDVIDIPNVVYKMGIAKRDEVILRTSGAFTALSFEDLPSVAAKLVNSSYRSPVQYNSSLIGQVGVGTNLVTGTPKEFNQYKLARSAFAVNTDDQREETPRHNVILLRNTEQAPKKSLSDLLDDNAGLNFDEDLLIKDFASMLSGEGVDTSRMDSFSAGGTVSTELVKPVESAALSAMDSFSSPLGVGDEVALPTDDEVPAYNRVAESSGIDGFADMANGEIAEMFLGDGELNDDEEFADNESLEMSVDLEKSNGLDSGVVRMQLF